MLYANKAQGQSYHRPHLPRCIQIGFFSFRVFWKNYYFLGGFLCFRGNMKFCETCKNFSAGREIETNLPIFDHITLQESEIHTPQFCVNYSSLIIVLDHIRQFLCIKHTLVPKRMDKLSMV